MCWVKRSKYSRAPARWASIRNYAAGVRLDTEITAGIGRADEARRLAALAVNLIGDPSLRAEARAEIARPAAHRPGAARFYQRRPKAQRREARH